MQRASEVQRRSGPIVALFVLGAVVLLAGFALALWSTQRDARSGINERFESSAVRVAEVVRALFAGSFAASGPAEQFSGPTVTQAQIDAAAREAQAPYAAVLDADGRLLAISTGAPAAVRERLLGRPRPTGPPGLTVSDVQPDPNGGSIEAATSFATPYGARTYVAAVAGPAVSPFLASLLAQGPNPSRIVMYLVDGAGRTIAGSRPVTFGAAIPDAALAADVRRRTTGSFPVSGRDWRFATAEIRGTPWRIVASAPEDRLYASVSGGRVLVPWLLVVVLAVAAGGTLWLLVRLLRAQRETEDAYVAVSASHEDLERSNAELAQFASIASHDLQEPLRKVQAFGEELAHRYGDALGEEGGDYLARMRRAAERMQALIDDLLRLARISTRGEPLQPLALDGVLADVLDDLAVTFSDAGAEVRVDALPTVLGDRAQLEQVFRNLLSNAVKFARPGVAPRVEVTAAPAAAGMTEILVRDNGIGFEQVYADRIFETFQRLHRRDEYPGTGIGLALCRKIVDRHGGTIHAESTPGAGTVLRLTLQTAAAATPAPAGPVAQPVGGPR